MKTSSISIKKKKKTPHTFLIIWSNIHNSRVWQMRICLSVVMTCKRNPFGKTLHGFPQINPRTLFDHSNQNTNWMRELKQIIKLHVNHTNGIYFLKLKTITATSVSEGNKVRRRWNNGKIKVGLNSRSRKSFGGRETKNQAMIILSIALLRLSSYPLWRSFLETSTGDVWMM